MFTGGFTSCAVGVSAALIFGFIASLIFEPKMKKSRYEKRCQNRNHLTSLFCDFKLIMAVWLMKTMRMYFYLF